mgnify:CR=1 FL=1
MNKIKKIFCDHDYKFFPEQLNGLREHKVKSICVKCKKNFEFTYEKYLKLKKDKAEKGD